MSSGESKLESILAKVTQSRERLTFAFINYFIINCEFRTLIHQKTVKNTEAAIKMDNTEKLALGG
jgi:hypothetical protein